MLDTEKLQEILVKDLSLVPKGTGENDDPRGAAAELLQRNFLKKFSSAKSTKGADDAALLKFMESNQRCADWILPDQGRGREILELAKKLAYRDFYDFEGFPRFSYQHIGNLGMVGPGAALLADGTDLFHKLFHGPISATSPRLHRWYQSTVGWNDLWKDAELQRRSSFKDRDNFNAQGNKMFFVPKDANISRPACTEPTLNMFFQKGLGDAICKFILPRHGIDLSVQQDKNKWFARSGSLNGNYGTIDLRSASDTISWNFVQWLLPPEMCAYLALLRAKHTVVPRNGGNESIELQMVSTMGNGFTFPLQTWIFAVLTQAVYVSNGYPVKDPLYGHGRQYSVFGDDIICESKAYDDVVLTLTTAGFAVNVDKSFNTGPFRESCGGDYFKGSDVRAVYFKECESPEHLYSVINRLSVWCGKHKIMLPSVFEYLLQLVDFRPVPLYEEVTAGIRVPLKGLTGRRRDPRTQSFVYHGLVSVPSFWDITSKCDEKTASAQLIAFLHGSLSCRPVGNKKKDVPGSLEVLVTRRTYVSKFRSLRQICPIHWDFWSEPTITGGEYIAVWDACFAPYLSRKKLG